MISKIVVWLSGKRGRGFPGSQVVPNFLRVSEKDTVQNKLMFSTIFAAMTHPSFPKFAVKHLRFRSTLLSHSILLIQLLLLEQG
jgi:hypothetical protein